LALALFIIIIASPLVESILSGATYLNPLHLANAIIAVLCILTGYVILHLVALFGGLRRARRFIEGFIIFLALFFIVLTIENIVTLVLLYPLPTTVKKILTSTVRIEVGRNARLAIPLPYVLSILVGIGGLVCIELLHAVKRVYTKILEIEKKGEAEVNKDLESG